MGKPAARVGDMHTCPLSTPTPHVGGPVMPPGKPTVFIGGMPAATILDMCTCAGPPDMIIQGSSSVFINGLPAARMGDMTVHGGRIVSGCFTVLIGDDGNSKLSRSQARLALIANGRQQAQDIRENVSDNPWQANRQLTKAAALSAAANRLERNNRAIERARLANDIYNIGKTDKNGNPVPLPPNSPPEGWRVTSYKADKKTGTVYAVYESDFERPAKPVLVFRGTQTGQDWKTNGRQGVGVNDEQYKQSIDVALDMKENYGPDGFDIAGHSKAGGQTAAASIVTGAKGYGFNSAGVHQNTVGRYGHSVDEARQKRADGTPLVESYNFAYDPLSNLQDKGVPALKTGLRSYPNPVTQSLGEWLTYSGAGPSAAGQRYVLPAVDEQGHSIPYDPRQILAHHGVEMLIASMEHEKQVDFLTLIQ